jgi:hypothetical protein
MDDIETKDDPDDDGVRRWPLFDCDLVGRVASFDGVD